MKMNENENNLHIRVIGADGEELDFLLGATSPFKDVMAVYCQQKCISYALVRFLFDGQRISPSSTPEEMEMEDMDVIDVMLLGLGGENAGGVVYRVTPSGITVALSTKTGLFDILLSPLLGRTS